VAVVNTVVNVQMS